MRRKTSGFTARPAAALERGRARAVARRRGGARAGDLLSPGGRIAEALGIDAAWQNLWRDQYTRHVPDRMRSAFEEDYKAWQKVKEQLADMSRIALMLPGTAELLNQWREGARSWTDRFKDFGVTPTAPKAAAKREGTDWESLAWAIAATAGGLALLVGLLRIPRRA